MVKSDNGRLEAERLIDALGPRTRVLAVSMVQFTSGYRVDLGALGRACEARGVLLVADAIQGLGVFPVDVRETGVGALATDGRKWLMGPAACGFLYVRPDWVPRISPSVPGALSVTNFDDHLQYTNRLDEEGQIRLADLYRPAAGRYETGFYNMVGLAGLSEALSLGDEIGRERIRARVTSLVNRLVRGVGDRGWDVYGPRTEHERSGIVSFTVPASPETLFRGLNAAAFSISVRDGRLRASPHVYNTADEVDAFLSKLDELVRS
jgi:selenocysteine lyase/cysteine desulfurase